MKLIDQSPDDLNELFKSTFEQDLKSLGLPDFLGRWLFAERLKARGVRGEMGFEAFEGPGHIAKFFDWLRQINHPDTFRPGLADTLTRISVEADEKVFAHYGLPKPAAALQNMARYNAQDYIYQRAYPVPERNRLKVLLDFGAGHGRIANLSYNTPDPEDRLQGYIAVEGIPSTYFTQHFYWTGLGLSVWDYFEHLDDDLSPDVIAQAVQDYDVVHVPTWRSGLVPDGIADMVNCIQVLKELPGELVAYIIPEFARMTGASGAIYLRDHLQFHNPNHMPIDLLIRSNGFEIEFAPQIKDRKEIHGVPRIWRKVDAALFL